jgi:hypothetical protein
MTTFDIADVLRSANSHTDPMTWPPGPRTRLRHCPVAAVVLAYDRAGGDWTRIKADPDGTVWVDRPAPRPAPAPAPAGGRRQRGTPKKT